MKTTNIAVRVCGIASYEWEILAGVRRFAHTQNDWCVIPGPSRPEHISSMGVSGIITSMADPVLGPQYQQTGVPLVNVVSPIASETISSVWLDNEAVGRMAAQFFLERGFNRVVSLSHPEHELSWQYQRHRSFVTTCRSNAIDCTSVSTDFDDIDSMIDALMELPTPSGLFALCDRHADMLIRRFRGHKIAVPEQWSILGVNNLPDLCYSCQPNISSVDIPWEEIGFKAARELHRLLTRSDKSPRQIKMLPTGVIQRESTLLYGTTDPLVARALSYIRTNAADRITVDDVYDAVDATSRTLLRRFRKELNMSVQDSILQTRLHLSKDLLRQTGLPLHQIAAQCGFPSVHALHRSFSQRLGITPGQYRTGHADGE